MTEQLIDFKFSEYAGKLGMASGAVLAKDIFWC